MSKQDVINKAVKSNEPPVWLHFSAGGSVSAIFFTLVILIFALLLPFGIVDAQTISTFAHTWIGKIPNVGGNAPCSPRLTRLKSTPPSRGRDFLWIIRGLHRCCSLLNIKPVILQAV